MIHSSNKHVQYWRGLYVTRSYSCNSHSWRSGQELIQVFSNEKKTIIDYETPSVTVFSSCDIFWFFSSKIWMSSFISFFLNGRWRARCTDVGQVIIPNPRDVSSPAYLVLSIWRNMFTLGRWNDKSPST